MWPVLPVLRLALRRLNRRPGFAAAVVVCWSLGLGAGVSTFWLADSVFFRPPIGVSRPSQVVRLYAEVGQRTGDDAVATDRFTYEDFLAARSAVGHAATIAAYGSVQGTITAGGVIRTGSIGVATPAFFNVLGTQPTSGRLFGAADTGAALGGFPVVLSAAVAQSAFGNTSLAIGKVAWLNGVAFVVVGVVPNGFSAGDPETIDAWVPIAAGGPWGAGPNWSHQTTWWLSMIGRLSGGASASEVSAAATVGLHSAHEVGPTKLAEIRVIAASVVPARGPTQSPLSRAARWLAAGGGLLLLIAIANVAGLLVLRGVERQPELGMQRILGASVQAIGWDLASEVLVLALLGGLGATALAGLLERVTTGVLLPGSPAPETIYSLRALLVMGVAVGLSAVAAGVGPTVIVLRRNLRGLTTDPHATGAKPSQRLRLAITAVQVFSATLLLTGALAFTTTLFALQSLPLGLRPERVVLVTTSHEYARAHATEVARTFEALRDRAREIPGVDAASLVAEPPLLEASGMSVSSPEHPEPIQLPTGTPYLNMVDGDYFRVIGTRIVQGRTFSAEDRQGAPVVLIVNETLAHVAWPGQDALKHCLILGAEPGGPCVPIVGVAEDARMWTVVPEAPIMQLYAPAAQYDEFSDMQLRTLLLRVRGDPMRELPMVERLTRSVASPSQPVTVEPLGAVIEPQIRPWRASRHLFDVFGGVALVLTCMGIAGALLQDVRQRRREVAIRLALGGSRKSVLIGVMRFSMACTVGSCVVAAFVGWWLLRRWSDMAFEWKGHEPVFAIGAALIVGVSGALAAGVPAWNATGLPIAKTLRE